MKKYILLLVVFLPILLWAPEISDDYINARTIKRQEEYKRIKQHQYYLSAYLLNIAYTESRLNPLIVNSHGCVGLYQFSPGTLKHLGIKIYLPKDAKYNSKTKRYHLRSLSVFPIEKQKQAMLDLMRYNHSLLFDYIKQHDNTIRNIHSNQILITTSGILAAAHLSGARNVKLYFDSNGRYNPKDSNGTSLEAYLIKFSGYNFQL